METITSLLELAKLVGVSVAICLIALFSLYKGWFVPGRVHVVVVKERDAAYEELRKQRSEYLALLNRHHAATEKAVRVMEKLAEMNTWRETR